MKSLSDLVPAREYVDITDEVPDPDGPELQILLPKPDDTSVIPSMRIMGKKQLHDKDWITVHRSRHFNLAYQILHLSLDLDVQHDLGHLDLTVHPHPNLLVWTYQLRMYLCNQSTPMVMKIHEDSPYEPGTPINEPPDDPAPGEPS